MIRILSLNCWGGMVHQPLLDYLGSLDADVYCLQEVVRGVGPQPEWLTYRDGAVTLDQRTELHREIAAALPGHDGRFYPAARGLLDDGSSRYPSEFGLATFVRASLPVTGEAMGFVHGHFSDSGWGDHPRPRNAHVVRTCDPASGRGITIAQMHGLRDPAGKHDTAERRAQAERFALLIGSVRQPGDLVVACGDFNVEPGSETLAILGRLGLTDLVTSGGHAGTRTSLYAKPGRFADYMLVSDTGAVAGFDVVRDPEVSDHCPLRLTLK